MTVFRFFFHFAIDDDDTNDDDDDECCFPQIWKLLILFFDSFIIAFFNQSIDRSMNEIKY